MATIKFYSVKLRKNVDVDTKDVKLMTMKNGRKAATAEYQGNKLYKILSKEDAAKL
jgi:uncharacterized protein YneF (UPF0154 family)